MAQSYHPVTSDRMVTLAPSQGIAARGNIRAEVSWTYF